MQLGGACLNVDVHEICLPDVYRSHQCIVVTSPVFDDIDYVVAGTREFVANGYTSPGLSANAAQDVRMSAKYYTAIGHMTMLHGHHRQRSCHEGYS